MLNNNHLPLSGLKIVVTRPTHQAKKLCQRIETLGGHPLSFPTIAIESLTQTPHFQQILHKINDYDIAIFVSANAVENTAPLWQPPKKPLTIVAIGPGTAQALTHHGIKVDIIPEQFSSEGILALPIFTQLQHKKIIIFCGEDSRPFLRETLTQRGAVVNETICYRRYCPKLNASQKQQLLSQQIDYIITTSQESLLNLCALLKSELSRIQQIPLVVISPTMHTLASEMGFPQVIIAENATDDAVVQALLRQV